MIGTSVLLLAAAAVPQPAPPVFRAAVELIRVETLVSRGGEPVRGLGSGDFELRDAGVPQALEPLIEEHVALDAVLVLDHSRSVSGRKLGALREAGTAFLDGLRRGERAAVLTFSAEVTLAAPLTDDLPRVRAALSLGSTGGSTALRDAVYAGLRMLEPEGRRTAVVVFSDGQDNTSWLQASTVVEAARRSEAIVYAVLATEDDDADQDFLKDVARATGGRLFTVRHETDLRARFLSVLEDIRSRYVLSYVPRGADRPGWHALEVLLKGRRGTVLARPGYWRPDER